MGMQKIHTFNNTTCAIEDVENPKTGKVEGRCFILIDNDSGDVYRYPMSMEVAKKQGKLLMGLGGVDIADGADLSALLGKKNGSP